MLRLLCDRCKKVISPAKNSYSCRISGAKNTLDGVSEVDFCDSCYAEFIKWIEKGKENEE